MTINDSTIVVLPRESLFASDVLAASCSGSVHEFWIRTVITKQAVNLVGNE